MADNKDTGRQQVIEMLDVVELTPMQSSSGDMVQVIQYAPADEEDLESDSDNSEHNTHTEFGGITREQEKDLTNKFLNGELSFSEYAAIMEGDEVDENTVDPQVNQTSESFEFENDLQAASRMKRKKDPSGSGAGRRKPRRTLPPVLQGLMGEANLRFARGERELAVKMCLEIIRQVPTAPEPFETLAVLYEELGSPDKSLQFALIAAHLNPCNADQWIRLAAISEEHGNGRQAVTCYTRAIKADVKNIDVHMKRARLLDDIGDKKAALRAYMRLLSILTSEQGPIIVQIAKTVAMRYHEDKELSKAREAMEFAFRKCPELITSEEVNMMLELLLSLKDYSRCLEILAQHCQLEVELEASSSSNMDEELKVLTCSIPDSIAIDLQAKLTVVMVHLKAFHLIDELINLLMNKASPEEAGDLYLDVAEALISENRHEQALELTSPLVKGNKYSLPAVWLRHAESLKACKRYEEAAAAYEVLVEQAPQHLAARITLSGLFTQLGRVDKALAVLTQDPRNEVLDPGLLYERCMLLKDDPTQTEEYIAVGHLLLSRHCVNIRNRDELSVLSRLRRIDKKKTALCEVRKARGESEMDTCAPHFEDGRNAPSVEEEWQLLYDLCRTCRRTGRYSMFQRLAFSALGSQRFGSDVSRLAETEFLALLACLHNNDTFSGYNLVRELVLRRESRRVWNLFNQIVQRADHTRHNRFFIRLMMRHLDHEGLLILHANSCLVAGTYKYALTDYMSAFRVNPNPMVALLIGITLFQLACQKFSARKNSLVIQALAFFGHYQQLRGAEGQQEVSYNLGRAFHQLGLLPAAIYHYEKALAYESDLNARYSNILDLKREAAFNLHLIYLQSDNLDLARYYTNKYISV